MRIRLKLYEHPDIKLIVGTKIRILEQLGESWSSKSHGRQPIPRGPYKNIDYPIEGKVENVSHRRRFDIDDPYDHTAITVNGFGFDTSCIKYELI